MTVGQLSAALSIALDEGQLFEDDELVKNAVGNLTVVRGNFYVGFIDLRYADIEMLDDDQIEELT